MVKRFTTTPHHDPTITSKVRTVLMEGGHYDLLAEQFVDGMRDIEGMARSGLVDHEKRLKMLEDAERDRLTQTSVTRLIDAKLTGTAVGWGKWLIRAMATGLGGAFLVLVGWILKMAWKGAMHQ